MATGLVVVALLGACTSDDGDVPASGGPATDTSDQDTPETVGPAEGTGAARDDEATADPDATTPERDTEDPDRDHDAAGSPQHGSLAALTSEVGEHLATRDAWAVYVHIAADSGGTSSCTGGCLDDWPTLTATDDLDIAGGVDAGEVGTVEREDGTEQLTYTGLPLHLYAAEEEPGEAAGHGHDDVWSVISPEGELLLDE